VFPSAGQNIRSKTPCNKQANGCSSGLDEKRGATVSTGFRSRPREMYGFRVQGWFTITFVLEPFFCDRFSNRIKDKYVVHTKDYKWENGIHYISVYMVPFL